MSPRLLPLLLLAVLSPASGLTLVLNRRTAVRALAAAPLLGSAPVLADDPRLNSAGFAEIKRLKDAQKQLNTAVRREGGTTLRNSRARAEQLPTGEAGGVRCQGGGVGSDAGGCLRGEGRRPRRFARGQGGRPFLMVVYCGAPRSLRPPRPLRRDWPTHLKRAWPMASRSRSCQCICTYMCNV